MNDRVNVPKPKKPTAYRNSDLLTAFDNDFNSKCYLTELKYATSWSMDVEHFIPQVEDPSLVFEWTNLYPANAASNQMKPRSTPVGGYLKPCDPADDVEAEISVTCDLLGDKPDFQPVDPANIMAANTCALLNRVHNGHDAGTKKLTSDLRHAIMKKRMEIILKILEWKNAADGSQIKRQAERDLRDLLSRKSSFTMINRAIPAVIQYVPLQFLD
jgi:hypothetical protein